MWGRNHKCGKGTRHIYRKQFESALKYPTVLMCNLKKNLLKFTLKKTCCAIDLREKTCREERSKPPLGYQMVRP